MNAHFSSHLPDNMNFKLSVVASLKEWKSIAKALQTGQTERWTPSGNLAAAIQELVSKAEREFAYFSEDKPNDSSDA